ncbi:YhjD/YihY/BrkB family envelope integrity protein [Longimicrobium sp.]|uniref:YhjD/YihY/BrkB family envelope integrity protein n=1 Tax=Longimicrobium sp. TaxID=2029185 RepID=UPI002C29E824|nr:YhjD/YihY/BrkB family envelope integrity protein [Longimicrobium sp.]HSU12815.1 YhjD/YihY/BrkB family envelope integrity protein [Longimicrobium sp.]
MTDPTPGPDATGERSLGELFRRLGADASALVRHEVALAKLELRQNLRSLASDAGKAAAGAAIAAVGALVLLEALVFGVGDLLGRRYWLSALIVGVLLVTIGVILLLAALKHARSRPLAPEVALGTLRETGDWAKDEAAELRSALAADAGAPRALSPAPLPPPPSMRGGYPRRDADDASTPVPGTHGAGSPVRSAAEPPLAWPLWKRVWTKYKNDDIPNQAAKVAYYFFMSLPPLLMAGFGLAGVFGGQDTADWLTGSLRQNLPAEAGALVNGFVNDVVHKNHPGLLSLGLLLAMWSGAAVFMALEDTLNAAWHVDCARGFVKRRAVALGTLLGVGILFLAGSVVLVAGPALAKGFGLGVVWTVVQWPLGFALVVGAFWIVYYVLPNVDQRGCKLVLLKASAIAAGLWVLATLGFRLYAANFGSYSKTYGVLGGIIVLLLWMYYTSTVILLGGEFASEMERRG